MPVISGGRSGFAPVSVVLTRSSLDIHAAGTYPLLWDGLADNVWDFNTLSALPAGLGLSLAFDGSSGNITTTTNGVWSFALYGGLGVDTAWTGSLTLPFSAAGSGVFASANVNAGEPVTSETVALASGDGAAVAKLATVHAATANPYNVGPFMSIVRLA